MCRAILGALGRKVKLIEFHFTADTTAFAVGDVITLARVELDSYDFIHGNARLVEYTVEQRHATTVTKKAINAFMYHDAPTSMTVAVNAADTVSALDFVKLCGVVGVATGDYVDYPTASEVITVATKSASTDDLPILWNNSTDSSLSKVLWVKILAGEVMTFSASTLVHIKLQIEMF